MTNILDKHVLSNGMVVLGEPMEQVSSVAFTFMVPAGAGRFDDGCCGAGSVITDWLFRGAGDKDSRALIDVLDGLGLHRGSSVSSSHISLNVAMEASNLAAALEIYADIIQRPMLDADQFDLSRQLAIHDVIGLDDDPRQKVMVNLYEQFYPNPLGRPTVGKIDELEALTAEQTREIVNQRFNLSQTIFAVAGKYDFDAVCRKLEELFDREEPGYDMQIPLGQSGKAYTHIQHEGAQVHIGLMTGTIPITSEGYYDVRTAVSILSGGMSSRLFTEVREKRGLCYAVGAQYNSKKECAGISCYAGTAPDTAQETLDVIRAEFGRLSEGISQDEVQRSKVGLKSGVIMQSESSLSRASGIANDYYMFNRVRPLEEIKEKIEQTSVESITKFLVDNRFKDYTVVTIGPKEVSC